MKQAKLLINKNYFDTILKRNVQRNEEIFVSFERGKQITDAGFATIIETIEDEPLPEYKKPAEIEKQAPKKRTPRKKKK